jgi:hypothetical protein
MIHTTAIGANRGALVSPFGQKDIEDKPDLAVVTDGMNHASGAY